ncbi:hypothetical protein LEMLEM_LOCUS5778 [Lemmus lemmus]
MPLPSPPLFSFAHKQQWQLATAGFEPVWALCEGRLGSAYNSGDTGDQHRVPAPSGRAGNSGTGACGPWKSLDPRVGLARTKDEVRLPPDFQSNRGDVWRRDCLELSGAVVWGRGANALRSSQHHGQNHRLPSQQPEVLQN